MFFDTGGAEETHGGPELKTADSSTKLLLELGLNIHIRLKEERKINKKKQSP